MIDELRCPDKAAYGGYNSACATSVKARPDLNSSQIRPRLRDGMGVKQLTDAAGEFVTPRRSPDGTKIMCARRLGDMNIVIFPAPR